MLKKCHVIILKEVFLSLGQSLWNGDKLNKAIIFGITSEIGEYTAEHLKIDNWDVYGTSRTKSSPKIAKLDLHNHDQVENFIFNTQWLENWTLACFFAATMKPIGPFFNIDFKEWEESIYINIISQISLLHKIWPYRNKHDKVTVSFLAGGGTNSEFDNYSAYCISKIALIKFTELISSENPNSKFFIIGPGYMKTKIHNETLEAGEMAGRNLKKTLDFFDSKGTTFERFYDHFKWCLNSSIKEISGRNFSTVHDSWEGSNSLLARLELDPDLFKLRRKVQ